MKYLLLLLISLSSFGVDDIQFEERIKNFRSNLVKRTQLRENYKDLNIYWRELVDATPYLIDHFKLAIELPLREFMVRFKKLDFEL